MNQEGIKQIGSSNQTLISFYNDDDDDFLQKSGSDSHRKLPNCNENILREKARGRMNKYM